MRYHTERGLVRPMYRRKQIYNSIYKHQICVFKADHLAWCVLIAQSLLQTQITAYANASTICNFLYLIKITDFSIGKK